MLVISREKQSFRDDVFANFSQYIRPGDCLVLNDTRVFPARLHGRRNIVEGAAVEVLLIRALNADETVWNALVKPGKRVRAGDQILFPEDVRAEVLSLEDSGERTLRFFADQPISEFISKYGNTPLPPYIRRAPNARDRDRYQTIFAERTGSAAAPTAGLHFTPESLESCQAAGTEIARVTLHVGLGTFAPIHERELANVRLHEEHFEISEPDACRMQRAARLVCVGTTTVRTLESAALRGGIRAMQGETDLFIYPGFRFRVTGAMLTNFHLPQSSLLMLVCALAGRELTLAAYRHAVAQKYRFFSYGDCMLIE